VRICDRKLQQGSYVLAAGNQRSWLLTLMRLHFPNGESTDHSLTRGRVVLGSEPGEGGIRIATLKPQHALIELEPMRGAWLSVLVPDGQIHVNARPVKERAMLRLGDVIMVGKTKVVLKSDSDTREQPPPEKPQPAETQFRHLPNRVVLRAVSGPYFGKLIHLKARTVIGRGSDCDLVLDEPEMSRRHALIENSPEGIFLRDLGSANGTMVNGIAIRDTVLKPGDQIAFDVNRFLLEAPGWVPSSSTPTPQPQAQPTPRPQANTSVQRRLVPPPSAPAAQPAKPVGKDRTQQIVNWVLIIAGLTTLIALGIVAYLSMKGTP
jgi:pSer/pThr/pTyr-binding forkhead associated (FHA) protein